MEQLSSGSGSGYGYGDKKASAAYFQALLDPHSKPETVLCFWRSNQDGTPANGGSGTVACVGLNEEIVGPLAICSNRALHGTLEPANWKGASWWIVALHQPVQVRNDKFGALKRTFIANLGKCPF